MAKLNGADALLLPPWAKGRYPVAMAENDAADDDDDDDAEGEAVGSMNGYPMEAVE